MSLADRPLKLRKTEPVGKQLRQPSQMLVGLDLLTRLQTS